VTLSDADANNSNAFSGALGFEPETKEAAAAPTPTTETSATPAKEAPVVNGFVNPEAIPPKNDDSTDQPEKGAETTATETPADGTASKAGEEGTDADLDGFLGMDKTQADSVVAALNANQFAVQADQKPQATPTLSDEEIKAITEDLAMGDKAAAAFTKLAKGNPAAAAQIAGQPQVPGQPAQPAQPAVSPAVAAASKTALSSFLKNLEGMGTLDRIRMTPGMGDQILQTADTVATAMGAKTERDFEKALNMAYYAVDPQGVQEHFKKQGQDKVTGALKRRKGLIDATQAQTTSPRAGGDVSMSEVLSAYREGKSIRKLLNA